MIEPKPLSPEKRIRIEQLVRRFKDLPHVDELIDYLWAMRELLAAEQYWREAVKTAAECSDAGPSANMCYQCNFCKAMSRSNEIGVDDHTIDHKTDCAWMRAQE